MPIVRYCNVLKCADFLYPVPISDDDLMVNYRSSRTGFAVFVSYTACFQNPYMMWNVPNYN
jgi:hypothetical protein